MLCCLVMGLTTNIIAIIRSLARGRGTLYPVYPVNVLRIPLSSYKVRGATGTAVQASSINEHYAVNIVNSVASP